MATFLAAAGNIQTYHYNLRISIRLWMATIKIVLMQFINAVRFQKGNAYKFLRFRMVANARD